MSPSAVPIEAADTNKEALRHPWLTGTTASDKDLVADLRSRQVRARLRAGIQRVQLAKRIEQLKAQSADDEEDIPQSPSEAATDVYLRGGGSPLSRKLKGDIFRAVVVAKAREMRQQKENEEALKAAHAASH